MKHLRKIAILAVVAAALLAFTANASATETLTSPEYESHPLVAESEGHTVLHGSFGIEAECNWIMAGKIETNTAEGAGGELETLDVSNCTNEFEAHVEKVGALWIEPNGTVFLGGATLTMTVPIFGGIECIYKTEETDIGILTDSSETEGTATLDLEAELPRTGGSAFCGPSGIWTGSFVVTEPDELYLDN